MFWSCIAVGIESPAQKASEVTDLPLRDFHDRADAPDIGVRHQRDGVDDELAVLLADLDRNQIVVEQAFVVHLLGSRAREVGDVALGFFFEPAFDGARNVTHGLRVEVVTLLEDAEKRRRDEVGDALERAL